MNALAAWGLDTDDGPTSTRRTPAQRAARARSRKAGRARARLLREAGLESVASVVARCAAGAVRRSYLRSDEPTEADIARHWVDVLHTRFFGAFPGTVAAIRGALMAVSGGLDCSDAAERITSMASGIWALETHDRIDVLVAFLPGSPLTGILLDGGEEIFGALEADGLLERDGGNWRTTEAGRDAIVRYVGRETGGG